MASNNDSSDPGLDDIPRLLQQTVDTHQDRVEAYRVPQIPAFYRETPSCWFIHIAASFAQAGLRAETTKITYAHRKFGRGPDRSHWGHHYNAATTC